MMSAAAAKWQPTASGRKISPPGKMEETDPGQLLNEWLGELDNLQKGLHSPSSLKANHQQSRESSATPVHMTRRMSTPRVESPRLDSYRYSLINLEETLENDLDAILGELCALESHFPTSSSTSTASSTTSSTATVLPRTPSSALKDSNQDDCLAPPPPPPPPLMMSSQENIQKYLMSSEPQYITAESVRQNKLLMSKEQAQNGQKRTESPDNDSAFCDNTSSNSGSDTSQEKNKDVIKNQTGLQLKLIKQIEDPVAQAKAEKIKLAIEKIKEASIKKIFIKVFGEDGSAKSLLVDERMNVAQVCRMLAEKNHVKRDTQWGLVELLPDLHMERAYEDHELLVENLLMWKADSKNTLWFIKRPEVFDLFNRPEMYLLGETSSQIGLEMDDRARAELVEEYFASSGVGAPEVEGMLWLKAESKKSWKKFYFVLRTSGLYYAPKGKKTSKDLVCLARFDVNQVYYGVKWQPKFKSPTRHCFAIKHPQIQAKNPKYIRYLCADTEHDLNKWVTGIRVAKYGKQLYDNYRGIVEEMAHDDLDQLASSRFSADAVTLAAKAKVGTPDSNLENKSFDSALQDIISTSSCAASTASKASSQSSQVISTTAMVHTMPRNFTLAPSPQRSNSTGSLSEKSSTGIELGFNCDSPEGGTIKKKPAGKKDKGVRFMDSYSTIPDDLPPPPLLPHEESEFRQRRANNAKSASFDLEAELECLPQVASGKLQRRYSDESLVSNPAMLHSGVLIQHQDFLACGNSSGLNSSPVKSPEPNRPAPVLKPQIGRKPSIDKNMLANKKPEHISRQPLQQQGVKSPPQRSPSYEDTLRKCQSLTRQHSTPINPSQPILNGTPQAYKPVVAPKPPSPAVPPKPVRLDSKRIAHLPPSGSVHSRSPSANGRKNMVNQAFLNDLHQAMNQKRNKFPVTEDNGTVADNNQQCQPFPNRFSSGEYENVQQQSSGASSNGLKKPVPPPPLPKRNDETHLTWDRT